MKRRWTPSYLIIFTRNNEMYTAKEQRWNNGHILMKPYLCQYKINDWNNGHPQKYNQIFIASKIEDPKHIVKN